MARRIRVALVWLCGIEGLYLVLGNLFLAGGWASDLANLKPERFRASWDSAWTFYPGHLWARDVRLEGQVRRTAWSVSAEHASLRVALLPLAWREIRLPDVAAGEVTAVIRRTEEELAPAPRRDGGWTLRVDHVGADSLRSLSWNELALVGAGQAEMGFVKVLRGGPMEVLPSTVHFPSAVMTWKEQQVVDAVALDGRIAIGPHLGSELRGLRKLARTDLDLRVTASPRGIVLGADAEAPPRLEFSDATGKLAGRLVWRQGEIGRETTLRLEIPVEETVDGGPVASAGNLALEAEPGGLALQMAILARSREDLTADAKLQLRERTIDVDDLAAVMPRLSGHLKARWSFDSLAWLSELLPPEHFAALDGSGEVLADLKFRDGAMTPDSVLEVPQVTVTARALDSLFEGAASARMRFRTLHTGAIRTSLDAVLAEFRIAAEANPAQPYVTGRDLVIEAVADQPGDGESLDEQVKARLRFENAVVPDLTVYNAYLPPAQVRLEEGSGLLSADLSFHGDGRVGRGRMALSGTGVRLAVAGLRLEGNVVVNTRLARADLDRARFDIGGSSAKLSEVHLLDASGTGPADWWGEFDFDQARLRWGRPMQVDGAVRARMKDVGLLLDIYSTRKELPGWIEHLVDAGEASAEGNLRWGSGGLLVQPFEARNDRYDLSARLRLQEKRMDGDLFARWGILSLGVEFAGGERKLHIAKAREWYQGRPDLMLE